LVTNDASQHGSHNPGRLFSLHIKFFWIHNIIMHLMMLSISLLKGANQVTL
jgi:hypothetical protein